MKLFFNYDYNCEVCLSSADEEVPCTFTTFPPLSYRCRSVASAGEVQALPKALAEARSVAEKCRFEKAPRSSVLVLVQVK